MSILSAVGRTPMVQLRNLSAGQLFVKVEGRNPGGSVKDRVALHMIETAERQGLLAPGGRVIEPTSGNTGIGLAMVCAAKGYDLILTMPEDMSVERVKLLRSLGAEVVLTPAEEGMTGAIARAKALQASGGHYMPDQFNNPANVKAHYLTTGPEVLADLPDIGAFVAGIGSGGTITGVGRFLKERKDVLIVGVEPAGSPVLSGGRPGKHAIQGIGAGFVPSILDLKVVDRVVPVTDEDALRTARALARREGIMAGISSGAALWAGLRLSQELEGKRKIAVLLPDSSERYMSTALFQE